MGFKSFTYRILVAAVFIFASALVSNVQGQNQEPSRFSLAINGGVNFADLNSSSDLPVLESNLNTMTEQTLVFGSGLRYALTPNLSLEAGYKYSNIRGESGNFETTMHTASFKSIFSLNTVIRPFLSAGVGYDLYSFNSPSESLDDKGISYNAGVGLALKIHKNIDLFSHYEYHLAPNTVDNIPTADYAIFGFEGDLLTTLTGGLRINFPSKSKRPSVRSSRSSSRPVPVETSPSDEASPSGYSDFDSISRKIVDLEEDVNHLERRIEEQGDGSNSPATNRLAQRVENMEMLLQEVRSKLNDIPDDPVVQSNSGLAESIPRGNYVQIFASEKLSSAQKVRSEAISALGNRLNGTSEQVFITRRDRFYQVLIGELRDKEKATNIRNFMSNKHSDAFVIIFPRPMSLQSAYKDMQIVE